MNLIPELLYLENLVANHEINVKEASTFQNTWSKQLIIHDDYTEVKVLGGADVAFDYHLQQAFAVVILLDADTFELLEVKSAVSDITIPYCPGFLSFREVPAIHQAMRQLSRLPDLLVCDGQGIAHPRRFGLACHLGLLYNLPTIGCAKKRLFGFAKEPGIERGSYSNLYDRQHQIIGRVLRTKNKTKPLIVSTGHRVSLESACDWVMKLTPKYRLAETTRIADKLAGEFKKSMLS